MDFNEWFDVADIEHIRSFEKLQISGQWPEGFIPDDIVFKQGWLEIAMAQLADAYIEYMKSLCA